ncbi:6-bladed beta-propeller, partial [Parabacteroides sp. PF5-9]|uniref:6-bladed beta-propeller n=1 Tax=Parabacteroides sp. PF5-9 TaxID=1742404 RepID=UPI002474FD6F
MAGCGEENNQSTGEFITVDVSIKYPKKELILQDFLDVEYIPLETKDEFITTGFVQAIGKDV